VGGKKSAAKRMKVVHIETGRHLYGGAQQVLYLVEALTRMGIDTLLVCTRDSEVARVAREQTLNIQELQMSGDHDLMFVWRLMSVLKRERPDIVHLHSRRGADVLGGIAARLCGLSTILSRRVDNPERGPIGIKYRLFDRVITISRAISLVLLDAGIPKEKIVCVHSAADRRLFRPECDRQWFDVAFGTQPGDKVIGVLAQFIERKGHRYLIEALPSIMERHPEVRVIFFGRGPMQDSLETLVRDRQLENTIQFAGFREDIARVLPCLSMLVHPATAEGLGVALLQAASCGIPVVASNVGGVPEIIIDQETGLLVPPEDSNALRDAIISLLENPARAKKLGQAARQLVDEEFSIGKMAAGNLKVYRELADVN
jgi:glycosyltransferase involved in cell wall biosynthesis